MRIPLLLATLLALPVQAADWLYLTYPGDTLSQIGQTYLKNMRDWPKVQAVNGVPIPEHLPVNTRIKIPMALLKVTPAPVTVTAVAGNVRYKSGDGPFQPLTPGAQLKGGESVLSGPRSSAAYRFADGTLLTQQESSKLGFGRLAAYGKTGMVSTELSLDRGRLEATAAKQLAPAGGFKVVTPVAVAGLRGTGFRLNVDEAGKTLRNEVLEGVVGVAAQGREVRVEGGYGTLAEAGKPPQPPRALLPVPEAVGLNVVLERLPIAFAWRPVAGAQAYRAQVASDPGFTGVLLDDVTTEPGMTWNDDLPDGNYALRVRAIDAGGLEGMNRDHPFELDARPLPPAPRAPALGERLYRTDVEFVWAAAAEAHGYLLQIAPTPEFDSGVIERRLPAITRHGEPLVEGDWHWRAASLDSAGKQHVWSPHRAFRVQPLPSPPAAKARGDAGQAEFAWGPAKGAARYGLELGATPDLGKPLFSQETSTTSLAVPLKPGAYHWRVRGVEGDGQAGAWGTASPVVVPPAAPSALVVRVEGEHLLALWQGDAPAYQLELSADAGFAKPLASQETKETRASMSKPEPGRYWLRVQGIGGDGTVGPASRPVAVEIERLFPWWLLPLLLLVP